MHLGIHLNWIFSWSDMYPLSKKCMNFAYVQIFEILNILFCLIPRKGSSLRVVHQWSNKAQDVLTDPNTMKIICIRLFYENKLPLPNSQPCKLTGSILSTSTGASRCSRWGMFGRRRSAGLQQNFSFMLGRGQ